MRPKDDLVFDIGVNKGEDSSFYLAKGFRVVGVEANPSIYRMLAIKFQKEIASGQFTLLNKGVWSEATTLQFYSNLDNDHWSSFDPKYGCRQGTRYEVMDIECLTIDELVGSHGNPRYMKIDVEGADEKIIASLANAGIRPTFLSIEEFGVEALVALQGVGYDRFQMVPQRDKSSFVPPTPPREGTYVEQMFTGYDSGLFGLELPDCWLNLDDAREAFVRGVRTAEGEYCGPEHEWFDIHATNAEILAQRSSRTETWMNKLWDRIRTYGPSYMSKVG